MKLPFHVLGRAQGLALRLAFTAVYLVGCAAWLAGCGSHVSQRGGEASLSARSVQQEPVVAHQRGTIKHKDGSVEDYTRIEQGGARVEHDEKAAASGVSGEASGDKAALNGDSTPPKLELPSGGSVQGTGGTFGLTAASAPGALKNPLFWVGVLALLVCGGCVYLQLRRAALICGLGGAGLIVASFLPLWALLIVAVLAAGGLGFYVWAEKQHLSAREALRATVEGIETAPAEVKSIVKAAVARASDPGDVVTIAAVKARDGL